MSWMNGRVLHNTPDPNACTLMGLVTQPT